MRGDKLSHANRSRLHLGVSLNDQQSVVCEFCKTLDLKATGILLDRGSEQLRNNSDICDLCKLLSQCLLKRSIKWEGSLWLIRDHSTIKIAQDNSPLLSIYSHPGRPASFLMFRFFFITTNKKSLQIRKPTLRTTHRGYCRFYPMLVAVNNLT